MTVFQDAVDATFAAFGIDATYTPAGSELVEVRVIDRRPDTISGLGDTRIQAETVVSAPRTARCSWPWPAVYLRLSLSSEVAALDPARKTRPMTVWMGRLAGSSARSTWARESRFDRLGGTGARTKIDRPVTRTGWTLVVAPGTIGRVRTTSPRSTGCHASGRGTGR